MRKFDCFMGLLLASVILFSFPAMSGPLTVLAPSKPWFEEAKDAAKSGKQRPVVPEADILAAFMEPFDMTPQDMEMPQFFSMLYYPPDFHGDSMQPELVNLLGDLEEIRYLDKKAWGLNETFGKPGLYQFIIEGKPWWDENRNMYTHQQAKVALPVNGVENGWNLPTGQSFEILPLTRPFGLTAPALFSGRLMLDGKPLENVAVTTGLMNINKINASTRWHKQIKTLTNSNGEFACVLNQPGWWYCEAAISGSPLKGPDGCQRELERITIFWLFVDDGSGKAKNKN